MTSLHSREPGAGSREPAAGSPPTVPTVRRLLVVVRTVATLDRLRDVLSLTAGDHRIQTFFTYDAQRPSPLGAGATEALSAIDAPLLPWADATRSRFDLAVAASENDRLAELDAPSLVLPHGAGQQKYYPGTTIVSGLHPERIAAPAAFGLSHPAHLDRLARLSPTAAARATVIGDPSLERLRGSLFRVGQLQNAFGTRDQRLVLLASTFGPDSALGRLPDLPERLAADLPLDEYRVAVVLHPGIWATHGPWQVRAWLSRAASYGVQVVPSHEGWQAALLASSVVVSDHGSLALYAAALDKPLLLAGRHSPVTVPDSASDLLARTAPRWDPDRPPSEQLDTAIEHHDPDAYRSVVELLGAPDQDSAGRLRGLLYELLRLEEPDEPATFGPVVAPPLVQRPVPATVVGAVATPDVVDIERFPDLGHGEPRPGLTHRHLVADLRTASLAQLSAAGVVVTDEGASWRTRTWQARAAAEAARWPRSVVLADVVDSTSCAVWAHDRATLMRADEPLDPVALASLAYVRLTTRGHLPAEDRIRLGERVIRVTS